MGQRGNRNLHRHGQAKIPQNLTDVVEVAAGQTFSLALKNDGTVVAWGATGIVNATKSAGYAGIVSIAAGPYHWIGLKNDGTVVGIGQDEDRKSVV